MSTLVVALVSSVIMASPAAADTAASSSYVSLSYSPSNPTTNDDVHVTVSAINCTGGAVLRIWVRVYSYNGSPSGGFTQSLYNSTVVQWRTGSDPNQGANPGIAEVTVNVGKLGVGTRYPGAYDMYGSNCFGGYTGTSQYPNGTTGSLGSPAPDISFTVTQGAVVAGAATGLAATAGNSQVGLSWTAPSSNGGVAVSDYKVEFSSDSGSTWSTFADGTSTTTTTAPPPTTTIPAPPAPGSAGCPSGSTPFTDIGDSFAKADIASIKDLGITDHDRYQRYHLQPPRGGNPSAGGSVPGSLHSRVRSVRKPFVGFVGSVVTGSSFRPWPTQKLK